MLSTATASFAPPCVPWPSMCLMILGQWLSGNFCQRPKVGNLVSQRWFLWAMECQTPPKRFIAGRDWKALNAQTVFFEQRERILVSFQWFRWFSASASFRILHSQWSFYVFSSSHDVADQMWFQEPIALVPWVVVWPSSNRICYVRELSFEFEDVWSAAFFKAPEIEGKRGFPLPKNSQLTGEDIYWHFCMSADVFRMSLMYTYLYILITYCIVLRYAFWFLSWIPWMTWLNERWRSSFLLKFHGDLFMLFFLPSLSTSF